MAKSDKEYSIEEAQKLCLDAVSPLKEEYLNKFRKIIDNHYVDYAQYPKKCSGGYSLSTLSKDSRILMSFNYDLDSVSTLIHEGGHNVHHQYVSDNNPLIYRPVSNLVAEVASLTNECLLSSYLANNASSKEEKLSGINNILSVIVSNLFGAVREGKIEQDFYNYIDNGGTITKDYMDELTKKSLEKYYGKEVILDDYSKLSWIRRSHYYMNFYLYNYAFCISVACNVAKEILAGNKKMLDNYIKFLSTGNDVWPIDSFKILGVDLTNKKTYKNAIEYFDSLLDEFVKISKEGE
jgi:oligoendopeptidase F